MNILIRILSALIGPDIPPVKAMTEDESYEWYKTHSIIDPKTGNMIEIGDGTFKQKYKKS